MQISDFAEKYCIVDEKYIITESGKVYTIYKSKRGIQQQKPRKHSNGYLRATIHGKDKYIHRLVAECFIDNPDGMTEVNHKDGNKENNSVENLEWCTRSQNNRHAFQTGLRQYSELQEMAKKPRPTLRKLTAEQVLAIRESAESDTALSKKYGIARGAIYQIRKRKSYKEVG